MNSRVGALLRKAVRDFGILIFHEPVSWNVKQTNKVTVFDIGPRAMAPFKRELHKSPQCFPCAAQLLMRKRKVIKDELSGRNAASESGS